MKKEQIKKLIKKHKYIFIGEIHGTEEIPLRVFELLKETIKNKKVVFCLEIPKEANIELYKYLQGIIGKDKLFSSVYLKDAVNDSRINDSILRMYEKLYVLGCTFKGLENYDNENPNERDKEMASIFMNIINENKAHKYVVYLGNLHTIDKSIKIGKFVVNPIKTYLPKEIIMDSLTIQFGNGSKREVKFDKKINTVYYSILRENR